MTTIDELREAVVDGQAKVAVAKVGEGLAEGTEAGTLLRDGLIAGMGGIIRRDIGIDVGDGIGIAGCDGGRRRGLYRRRGLRRFDDGDPTHAAAPLRQILHDGLGANSSRDRQNQE